MHRAFLSAATSGGLCWFAFAPQAQALDRQLFASDELYQLHRNDPAYRLCDKNRDGGFQPGELPCYNAFIAAGAPPATPRPNLRTAAALPTAAPAANETAASPDPLAPSNQTSVLVRRSFADIQSFADPTPFDSATGAEFAWASDKVTDNDVWAAHGIVAVPFVHRGRVLRDDPYVQTLTLAPYINFDRVSNTEKTEEDVDNLIYGAEFEAGFANVFAATQYIRVGGNLVSSFAGESKNWSANVVWQPIGGKNPEGGNTVFSYLGAPLPLGQNFVFTLSPLVQTLYASDLTDAALQPIFAEHDDALRSGPTVTLAIDGVKLDYVPWWIQRIHYEITYGWLYDWLSGRDYELLDTALSLGLDEAGHLALTFSYRNGQLVATGQDIDLANIALSVRY